MAPDLPASFVTQLLNSLPAPLPQASARSAPASAANATATLNASYANANVSSNVSSNPLATAPDAVRKQLLALHVLFPNEFLPALDLLDRRLVTRFRIIGDAYTPAGHTKVKEGSAAGPEGRVASPSSTTAHARRGIDDSNAEGARTTSLGSRSEAQGDAPMSADEEEARKAVTSAPTVRQRDERDVKMLDVGSAVPPLPSAEDATHPHNPTTNSSPHASTTIHSETKHHTSSAVYYVRSAQPRTSRYTTSYDSSTHYEVQLHAWNCSCAAFAFSAFPSTHPSPRPLYADYELLDNEETGGHDDMPDHGWRFGGVRLGDVMPPVCKHILACVLVARCGIFAGFVEEKDVSVEEAAGWAAGWGD